MLQKMILNISKATEAFREPGLILLQRYGIWQ
jgi:hypothetical protein